MRALVFFLLLANLLFLTWTEGYLGSSANPDAFRVQQQLLADRVTVVARDEPPLESTKLAPTGMATERMDSETCLQLNDLLIADADLLETRVAEKLPAFTAVRTKVAESTSYWVFIPPAANKKEVDAKVATLKKLNVPEFFVVQESGPNNMAISLGLFSRKEAANSRLETLRGQGVKSAKVGERSIKPALASLEIRGSEAQAEALRQVVAEALPESKSHDCKPLAQ